MSNTAKHVGSGHSKIGKIGNFTSVHYISHNISSLIIPIAIVFYTILIIEKSPLQRGTACNDSPFVEWATKLNVWVAARNRQYFYNLLLNIGKIEKNKR